MRFIFYLFFFTFLFSNISYSQIKKIIIEGNLRIPTATIENYVINKDQNVDSNYINNLSKNLFDTNFFEDLKIDFKNNTLTIKVLENPLVAFFYVKGIDGEDLEISSKIIKTKEGSLYSFAVLKKDIDNLLEYFKSKGYYNTIIDPEVIKLSENKINLIINVNKFKIAKVKNIFFIGNKYFKDSDLIDVILSKEISWWKFFTASEFSEEKIERDKSLLIEYYKSNGFYDIEIKSAFATELSNGNFSITFSIESGKKYVNKFKGIIDEKKIYTNITYELSELFKKKIDNKIYSQFFLNKIVNETKTILEKNKFLNPSINIVEKKIESTQEIEILVTLDTLPQTYINKINILGNTITEERTIRDNLSFSEKDLIDRSKIKSSIDKLRSKGYFSRVEEKIIDSEEVSKKNFKDLEIKVKEAPSGSIMASAGYGNQGFLLEGSLSEANLLGKGINLSFTGTFTTEKILGNISYFEPNFANSGSSIGTNLFSELSEFKNAGYENKSLGNNYSSSYPIFEDLELSPTLSLQRDSLKIKNSGASAILKARAGDYITTSLGYGLFYDQRNSKFNPTNGYTVNVYQDYATFFSDISAIKSGIKSNFYSPLFSDLFIGTLKFNLATNRGIGDDIKISDRLYASNSDILGFAQRSIGPKEGGDYIGGNNLASFGAKTSFPNFLPEFLRPKSYFFYNAANVWGVDYSNRIDSTNKIRSSTGLTLDLTTPIGPVSFSYAVPLTKFNTDKEQKFSFNFGSSF